jgi:NAD+ kinase
MSAAVRAATVLTHGRPPQVAQALEQLIAAAARRGVLLRFDEQETRKHELRPRDGIMLDAALSDEVEMCIALGGDGTILRALRHYAGRHVPVFAVNFGEIGFLATVDPDDGDTGDAFDRALTGDFETLTLPALALELPDSQRMAINDLAIHRQPGGRVARLAYAVNGEEVGSVRCDGLVLATPAGSTGYNLANGGPVMAWGVEGFVVSFIAPHSLTARALVVAPDDSLSILNRSDDAVEVSVDGRPRGTLAAGAVITARFVREAADLAQVPGTSFYRRMREKFGRLAS